MYLLFEGCAHALYVRRHEAPGALLLQLGLRRHSVDRHHQQPPRPVRRQLTVIFYRHCTTSHPHECLSYITLTCLRDSELQGSCSHYILMQEYSTLQVYTFVYPSSSSKSYEDKRRLNASRWSVMKFYI